jgi:orotate phosphoribosyltransferase-like protein
MGLNTAPGGSCGPWYEFEKIREAWDEGKTVKEIAEDFKVSENTVRRYLINYSNYNSSESHRRSMNSDMIYKGIY